MKHFIVFLFTFILFTSFYFRIEDPIIIIKTEFGNIKIKLYHQTPKHRDNFIKLVKEHYYDSLLFHRVIKDFMIQGGDPDSKYAKPGERLGKGGPGYTIPAEIVPELIHKRGALAAARESDQVNPQRASSGSQFYIVQGKVYREEELDMLEIRINQNLKYQILGKMMNLPEYAWLKHKVDSSFKSGNPNALNDFLKKYDHLAEKELEKIGKFYFNSYQRNIYTTIGGSPHLDGAYTVFGEVIEGMNVVDSIANQKTDMYNRPLKDIRMFIELEK